MLNLRQGLFQVRDNIVSIFNSYRETNAALYHYYGVPKYALPEKMFGVFEHEVLCKRPIVRGFDDVFYAPHSRHTEFRAGDIAKVDELEIIAQSREAGVYLAASKDGHRVFVSGSKTPNIFSGRAYLGTP